MNLTSALFNRILVNNDFDTWSNLRRHYLSHEYLIVYDILDKHISKYQKLPTLDELTTGIFDEQTLDKIYAIQAIDVDAEPFLLLDYLKNEFTQKETLTQLSKFVDDTLCFETAEETVQSLYEIIADIEGKVDLTTVEDNMQKINLFETDDQIASYVTLGLNSEFDERVKFKSIDYILMGGKRGSGKSITCSNLAQNVVERGKSVLYFTIEMSAREVLQRQCSIATGLCHSKIKYKNLDNQEWVQVVKWWADRFENTEKHVEDYMFHRNFDLFHSGLIKEQLKPCQIDIIYDPVLTLPRLKAETLKRVRKLGNVGMIIVDYVNQIKRTGGQGVDDLYDWKEQIAVSKALKSLAQELGIPVFSPYQIDASGEARFSKGILDSADAAFVLTAGPNSIQFDCTKMRGDAMINFNSRVEWNSLKIGPDNGEPVSSENGAKKAKVAKSDTTKSFGDMAGIYDDS